MIINLRKPGLPVMFSVMLLTCTNSVRALEPYREQFPRVSPSRALEASACVAEVQDSTMPADDGKMRRLSVVAYRSAAVVTHVSPDSALTNYVVTTAANSPPEEGDVTLQMAMAKASASGGTITFNIPGQGPHIIQPGLFSPLPSLTSGITIDGGGNIQISGLSSAVGRDAFVVTGNNNTLRGLEICCFDRAIRIAGGANNTVEYCTLGAGNFIGIEIDNGSANVIGPGNQSSNNSVGLLIRGVGSTGNVVKYSEFSRNTQIGVNMIEGASGNTIGPGNVVGLNTGPGIQLFAAGAANIVQGNWVGTNQADRSGIGNSNDGIVLAFGVSNSQVFGNVVSGNGWSGIHALGSGTINNTIRDNTVGTSADGTAPLPNGHHGIVFHEGAGHNTVGPGNLVSGNGWSGLVSYANGIVTEKNIFTENIVGTNRTMTTAIPNQLHGVALFLGTTNTLVGPNNTIAGNALSGVEVHGQGTDTTQVSMNRLGIPGIGNEAFGCTIADGPAHTFLGLENTIVGNQMGGILLSGNGTSETSVFGNHIGIWTDDSPAPNNGPGVLIREGASNNIIGVNFTDSSGEPNMISNNGGYGVRVEGLSPFNVIRKNSIMHNELAGISVEPEEISNSYPPDILSYDPLADDAIRGFAIAPVNSKVDIYVSGDGSDEDPNDQAETHIGTALLQPNPSNPDSPHKVFLLETTEPVTGTLTATVTTAEAGNTTSSIAASHGRRVVFPDGKTPLGGPNVRVFPYRVDGEDVVRIVELEEGREGLPVADDGAYPRPLAFWLRDAGVAPYVDFKLGVLAEVTYTDVGLEAVDPSTSRFSIINYPENAPFKPLWVALTGYEDIVVPYPLILLAGLNDGVCGWSTLGPYFRADAGDRSFFESNDIEGHLRKAPKLLPAFLTFTMPSGGSRSLTSSCYNGVPWGFVNQYPFFHTFHNDNADRVHEFLRTRVADALAEVVPVESVFDHIRVNMCVHSMGGTYSRGWRYRWEGKDGSPHVARYVSLDGVHGATTLAERLYPSGYVIRGFAEWVMNGRNALPGMPPVLPGWNYAHETGTSVNNLLYTATLRDPVVNIPLVGPINLHIVDPDCSALGVGRTMLTLPFPIPVPLSGGVSPWPNGNRHRFIGGHEVYVENSHSQPPHTPINHDYEIALGSSKFLAWGDAPAGAAFSGLPDACVPARAKSEGIGLPAVPGRLDVSVTVEAHEEVEVPIQLDTNSSIDVSLWAIGSGASFDLVNGDAVSLLPPDVILQDQDGMHAAIFTLTAPLPTEVSLRAASGDESIRVSADIVFPNNRRLALGVPMDVLEAGDAAILAATVVDENHDVLVGTDSVFSATVTSPSGMEHAVVLADDGTGVDDTAGDGLFSAEFLSTDTGGRYYVQAQAITVVSGDVIQRTATGMFAVDSTPATLVGIADERVIDGNGDSLYDRVELDLEVYASEPGRYQVMGELQDHLGTSIVRKHAIIDAIEGDSSYMARFSFDAATLVVHGVDGPWTLSNIELIDDVELLRADTLPDYSTVAYDLADFALPPLPKLLRAVPNWGPLTGGNYVILEGENLSSVSRVLVGGAAVTAFDVLSETSIELSVPPSTVCAAGAMMNIAVETPWGDASGEEMYQYVDVRAGDMDGDCDVDLVDFAGFQRCYTGSNGPPLSDECLPADIDADGDIDLDDFVGFMLRGP